MHRLFKKKNALILACIITAIGLVTLAVNVSLSISEAILIRQVDRNLSHTISLGGFAYFFPNTLVIKNIEIKPKFISQWSDHVFKIPVLEGKVDLFNSLMNWELRIYKINIRRSQIPWAEFCEFLRQNHEEIIRLIKSLPEGNIEIDMQDTQFHLSERSAGPDYIDTDINFTLKDDWIHLYGSLDPVQDKDSFFARRAKRKKSSKYQSFLRFDLNGDYIPNGFILNSLTLNGPRLYTKLWGDLDGSILSIQGFSFLDTESRGLPKRPAVNILQRVGFVFRVLKGGTPPPDQDLSQINFYVTDIDARIKLDFPKLHFRQLAMLFNNAPLYAGGQVLLDDPLGLDLAMSFYPSASDDLKMNDLKRIDLKLNGEIAQDTYTGNSEFVVLLTERKKGLQWIQTGLNGMTLDFNAYPKLEAKITEGRTSCWVSGKEYRLQLSEAEIPIHLDDEIKTFRLRSSLYDGSLEGEMEIDTSQIPFNISSHFEIQDADANQFEELLIHFSKIRGRLYSSMDYYTHPKSELKGELNIQNGNLRDYEFFKWLAENFGMNSLLSVDFNRARAGFLINAQKAGVFDIDLVSRNLKINGDFFLHRDDLAQSKLSLFFHRRLIQESAKLSPILKFYPPETEFVDFDFRLSGNLHAMNFHWLENPSKTRIRNGLPNFVERIIDRRVNAGLK